MLGKMDMTVKADEVYDLFKKFLDLVPEFEKAKRDNGRGLTPIADKLKEYLERAAALHKELPDSKIDGDYMKEKLGNMIFEIEQSLVDGELARLLLVYYKDNNKDYNGKYKLAIDRIRNSLYDT